MKREVMFCGIVLIILGIVAVLLSFIQVPYATTELTPVPHSSDWSNESFEVLAYHYYYLHNLTPFYFGRSIRINFNVTNGGGLNFWVMNDTNFTHFNASQAYMYFTVPSRPSTTGLNLVWNPPSSGIVYFVWDNRNAYNSKFVSTHFTVEWTEMENQNVTSYRALLAHAPIALNAYMMLLFGGIATLSYGMKPLTTSRTTVFVGYVFAVLGGIIGLLIASDLIKKSDEDYRFHGKAILIISLVAIMSYLALFYFYANHLI